MIMQRFLFLSYLLMLFGTAEAQQAGFKQLFCEYRTNPVGIDVAAPSFGWQILSQQRGYMQSAFHIQVAEDAEQLINNNAGQWNSGKINSPESQLIRYKGKALQPGKKYFWRVRIWD